ncbi:GvpL/GvpF family gas vesicle protein [Streptomyces sp. NPDC049577]|uniref:GvpL/GvpF family gas vesicle protein n=1 Tax=Streptomyces sp. NPDC049577 TaxID=3155153 RepID=UPI0034469A36
MSDLLYAYALTRPTAPAPPGGTRGVGGAPVRVVRHAGLAAVVGPVPADEFGEAALRERLEDLRWLEATARAHQAVVAAVAPLGSVLPLRLATVHRDETGLRRALDAGRERFAADLERLDGCVEWGVKIYAVPAERAERPEPSAPSAFSGSAGREYLRRRRRERERQEHSGRRIAELCRHVHTELSRHARNARLHRPQDPRLAGTPDRNVLNAAYLVPRDRSRDFAARVTALDMPGDGLRLEMTGPWAPYSFVTEPTEPTGPAGPTGPTGPAGSEPGGCPA